MRGDRAARAGEEDLLERGELTDKLHAHLNRFFVTARVRDKNALEVDTGGVAELIGDVLPEHGGKLAAILPADRHFAVTHHNAGLQVQQIGAQCGDGGTATALVQKLQAVRVDIQKF